MRIYRSQRKRVGRSSNGGASHGDVIPIATSSLASVLDADVSELNASVRIQARQRYILLHIHTSRQLGSDYTIFMYGQMIFQRLCPLCRT